MGIVGSVIIPYLEVLSSSGGLVDKQHSIRCSCCVRPAVVGEAPGRGGRLPVCARAEYAEYGIKSTVCGWWRLAVLERRAVCCVAGQQRLHCAAQEEDLP